MGQVSDSTSQPPEALTSEEWDPWDIYFQYDDSDIRWIRAACHLRSNLNLGGLWVPFHFPCDYCCAAMTAIHLLFNCYSIADREQARQLNRK
ncbi:hypothetical protein Y032_0128g1445 [Ancylostoma ceylanicum]|uniref:Uncharacterized protein n=1 Tax=Ancylostoma ceylanicum TaxID=53326 RepID=A0A016T810_9BILA|nr:hypothetical protein Y032_0128g1445 [Ancylostoma ceylanicum]